LKFTAKKKKKVKKYFLHTENGSVRRSGYTYHASCINALLIYPKFYHPLFKFLKASMCIGTIFISTAATNFISEIEVTPDF
jgi:hypothetical protein